MASRISAHRGRLVEEETPTGKLSKRLTATGIMFRETTTDYENSWHRAPCRQYVISLAGGISITASDGETRHIGAGVIVLVEDTTGKGLRTVDGLLPKSFGQRRAPAPISRGTGSSNPSPSSGESAANLFGGESMPAGAKPAYY